MREAFDFATTRLAAGDPLAYAILALFAALATYALVRRLMRVRWLRILMRVGYFLGVVALVGLAGLTLAYYKLEAWGSVSGSVVVELLGSPATWVAIASVVAIGLALRKPVPPRHGIRVTHDLPDEPPAAGTLQEPTAWREAA